MAGRLRSGIGMIAAACALAVPASAEAATFTVSNLNDSGAGSLRRAIADATGAAGTDRVDFAAGLTGTIQLQSALPQLTTSMTIDGPGADLLTIRRDTGGDYGIFDLDGPISVTITDLTITNGKAPSGGAGGITVLGNSVLTLRRSSVVGNSGTFTGGLFVGFGSDATIEDSTFSANLSSGNFSTGAISAVGNVAIHTSTISGNYTVGQNSVGGVYSEDLVIVTNSTIASNSGPATANVRQVPPGTITLRSTIIANPLGGGANCGGVITSQGFNLESANSCALAMVGDQPSTNPLLGDLAANGGPTKTMALDPASPAIDRGHSFGATTDQRGLDRIFNFPLISNGVGDGADAGAFEFTDPDFDGIDSFADNCATVANPGQQNTDGDAQGNACDSDDDGDGVADAGDDCPVGAATGADPDGDGCKNSEDTDDDGDGVLDASDACPTGAATGTDTDGDGCKNTEDTDDDGDGVADASDGCPTGAANGTDADADGCTDAEDTDDDDDAVLDDADLCDLLAGAPPSGCPLAERTLKLKLGRTGKLKGRLSAPAAEACAAGQKVVVFRKKRGPDAKLGSARTKASGKFTVKKEPKPGKYYAKAKPRVLPDVAACGAAKSKIVKVG